MYILPGTNFLQTGIEPQFILFFDCPEEEMERRLLGRNQVYNNHEDDWLVFHQQNSSFYGFIFISFKYCFVYRINQTVMVLGEQGRVDDNIETIRKRFKVFVESSIPVVDYYETSGKVNKVLKLFNSQRTMFSNAILGPSLSVQLVEGSMMLQILIQFSWVYMWLFRQYWPNQDSDILVLFRRLMPPNQLTKSLIQFDLCLIASTMWYPSLCLTTSPWLLPPISSPFTFFPSDGWQNVKCLVYVLQLVLFDVFHHPEETKWSVILDIWNASCDTCSQVMAMRRNWQKLSSNITSMGLQWPSSTESQRSFFLQDTQTFLLLFHPSRMICAGFNWEHMCRWEAHCEYAHTCILGFSFILP